MLNLASSKDLEGIYAPDIEQFACDHHSFGSTKMEEAEKLWRN